jgi:hypothetical protein
MDGDPCEACGGRRVLPRRIEGVDVLECDLCGNLQGDDDAVSLATMRREGRQRGFDPRIYPLVVALERVPTFKVAEAEAGDADALEYPCVFLRVDAGGLLHLERLLTSLEMANRATRRRWVVEATLQRGLLFLLRPRFWKRIDEVTRADVLESQADLDVLAKALDRDVRLAWWQKAH